MADVKWIKIVTDIFDDEKILLIESMPEADAIIVVWFKLLCLAGKQNNKGVFIMNDLFPYTDEMFASIFRRPLATVRLALNVFEKFGMIERINDTVTIPNWDKHQSLDTLEKKRESQKLLMQKRRAAQKQLCEANCEANSKANSKANVSLTEIEEDIERDIEEDIKPPISPKGFEEWWSEYPKKLGKQAARKAYEKALKTADAETMLSAVRKQKNSAQWKKENGQYIPNPATWLNQGRWEDELPNTRSFNIPYDNEQPIVTKEQLEKLYELI